MEEFGADMEHSKLGNNEAEDRIKIKSEKLKLEPNRKLLCGSESLNCGSTDISRMWSVFFQSVNVSLNDIIKLHDSLALCSACRHVKMPAVSELMWQTG